jgi:hypothetical protein
MDRGEEIYQVVLRRRGEMESDVMITIGDPEETAKTILLIGRNINTTLVSTTLYYQCVRNKNILANK